MVGKGKIVLWLWRGWEVWDFFSWLGGFSLTTAALNILINKIQSAPLEWRIMLGVGILFLWLAIVAQIIIPLRKKYRERGQKTSTPIDNDRQDRILKGEFIPESYLRGRSVYLLDLIPPGAKPIIRDRTFEDCEVRGPAMIALLGGGSISNSTFDGDIDSVFVEVADKRIILGAIGLQSCVFRRCRFTQIGIIGTREQIEKAKKGFNPSTPDKEDS